jgi:hypothetical protein
MIVKKIKLTKSLRAQLPFSFAGIALLTTTLIGAVLLAIIWNYYTGLEKQYLKSNVKGTANNLSRIAENSEIYSGDSLTEFTDVFQNQAKVTAFLIQCRVRILDTNDNAVADTGSPSKSWNITVPKPKSRENNGDLLPRFEGEDDQGQSAFSIEPSENQRPQNDNPPAYSFQVNPNMFGYLLMQDAKMCSTAALQWSLRHLFMTPIRMCWGMSNFRKVPNTAVRSSTTSFAGGQSPA